MDLDMQHVHGPAVLWPSLEPGENGWLLLVELDGGLLKTALLLRLTSFASYSYHVYVLLLIPLPQANNYLI
jgi:hypothetical protein